MDKTRISYLITDTNITVNFNGQTHIVARTDKLGDRLIEAIKQNRIDDIPELVSAATRIEKFSNGEFVVRDGKILVDGVEAPTVLGNKIVAFANEGLPYQPLVKFASNLQKNPSYRSVQQLYSFLEKNDYPITQDGNIVAFKRVRSDFKDIYTGTIDNSIGAVVEMPRNQIDDNPDTLCSQGLHSASYYYASTQYRSSNPETDIMLEVEINPADVVSVPRDHENGKLRCCKYVVIGVVDRDNSSDVQLRITTSKSEEPEACSNCDRCCCNDCHIADEDKENAEYECENCGETFGMCECEDDYCEECDCLVNECECESEEEDADEADEYDWETELDDLHK